MTFVIWYFTLLGIFHLIGILFMLSNIGKPRSPLTAAQVGLAFILWILIPVALGILCRHYLK